MTANIETVYSGNITIGAVETDFATLTKYHPIVDVYVDSKGNAGIQGCMLRLYALTGTGVSQLRTLMWSGSPENVDAAISERLGAMLPGGGSAGMVLTAQSNVGNVDARLALAGYDLQSATEPDAIPADDNTNTLTTAYVTVCTNANWRPRCDLYVSGPAGSLPAEFQLCALLTGMAPAPVAYGMQSTANQRIALDVVAGGDGWIARGRTQTPAVGTTRVVLNAENPTAGVAILAAQGDTGITSDVWIDPVNGSDANAGTQAAPLKTAAELARRWGPKALLSGGTLVGAITFITINLVSDLPVTDPLNLEVRLTGVTNLRVLGGTPTPLALAGGPGNLFTGTFTAVTALNRATNQAWEVTDAALPAATSFNAAVGHRGRVTAGARAGQVFWPTKGLGAKNTRVSALQTVPDIGLVAGFTGLAIMPSPWAAVPMTSPTVADAYQIEDPVKVALGDIRVTTDNNSSLGAFTQNRVVFQDLTCIPRVTFCSMAVKTDPQIGVFFVNCALPSFVYVTTGKWEFINCAQAGSNRRLDIDGAMMCMLLGGYYAGVVDVHAGNAWLDFDVMIQGGASQAGCLQVMGGGAAQLGAAAFYDSVGVTGAHQPGCGIYVGANESSISTPAGGGGVVTNTAGLYAGAPIQAYGSGAADVGLLVSNGGKFFYNTTTRPTVTGALGDIRMGGLTLTTLRTDTFAAIGPINLTWANFAANYAGAGFQDNATNFQTGAIIAAGLL